MADARILLFDIESAPNISYTWGKYDQNVVRFEQEWFLLSFAWKWLGEKTTLVAGLDDYPGYKRDKTNDRNLALSLRRLIDEADVVIAHNGDGFDMPKARARWLVHDIDPPSPVKTIDTLKIARRVAMFNSNKLGDLGETLGLGNKAPDGGFDTWLGCMAGDPKAWAKMKRYNKADVDLLERVYLRLLPYIERHPNLALISERPDACPQCLVVGQMQSRGLRHFGVTSKRQWYCRACRHYSYTRVAEKTRPTYAN